MENQFKMGCDGGTIPKRDELVKTKKKPEQVLIFLHSFVLVTVGHPSYNDVQCLLLFFNFNPRKILQHRASDSNTLLLRRF